MKHLVDHQREGDKLKELTGVTNFEKMTSEVLVILRSIVCFVSFPCFYQCYYHYYYIIIVIIIIALMSHTILFKFIF